MGVVKLEILQIPDILGETTMAPLGHLKILLARMSSNSIGPWHCIDTYRQTQEAALHHQSLANNDKLQMFLAKNMTIRKWLDSNFDAPV